MKKGYAICLNEWIEDERLKSELKILLKISSLCADRGYCWATNKYFAEYFNTSIKTVSTWISTLIKYGYISSKLKYVKDTKQVEKRVIRLKNNTMKKTSIGIEENFHPPMEEKVKDNSINNNINNSPFAKDVVAFLNSTCNKKFKHTTKATLTSINARKAEGYTLEDFKKVILVKSSEWTGTEMEKFLRPSTLFNPTKFENYLNQPVKNSTFKMLDTFKLPINQESKYQTWLKIGNDNYPALMKSDTKFLTRRNYHDLGEYAKLDSTRVVFAISEFQRKIQSCLEELNDKKWLRDSNKTAFDYIMKEVKKDINNF